MKAAEVRDLETEELHVRVAELKEELFNLRFQLATGQLDNHRRIRQVKQDIARIRTLLRERDFAAAEAARRAPTESPAPQVESTPEPQPPAAEGERYSHA